MNPLKQIRIVLVEPSHPGNVGAVARAMKTMGIERLVMVKPKKFPHYEATKRAAGAENVLSSAIVVDSIDDAIKDCTYVMGTSVRDREVTWPTFDPKVSADKAIGYIQGAHSNAQVAVLFGRESSGLKNEELDLCQSQIRIDANDDYSSLNLASAVQIVSYELRMKWLASPVFDVGKPELSESDEAPSSFEMRQRPATINQMEGHIEHLQNTLEALDFSKSKTPTLLMRKLKRLYSKADLTVEEIQILRGILTSIQSNLNSKSD